MGMYNIVFGNEGADLHSVLLTALGIESFGRFRDCWIENIDGEPVIAVYTRNGGGNRECYQMDYLEDGEEYNEETCTCTGCTQTRILPSNPYYLRDADDDFDFTYCTNYFRTPDEYRDRFMSIAGPVQNKSDQWLGFIDALKRMPKAENKP